MNLAENSIFDQFLGLGGPLDGSESSRITRQTKELSDSRAKCDHREFHQDTKTLRSREDVQSGSEGKSCLTKHFSSQEVQVEQWADTSWNNSLGGGRGMQNHEGISEVTKENRVSD